MPAACSDRAIACRCTDVRHRLPLPFQQTNLRRGPENLPASTAHSWPESDRGEFRTGACLSTSLASPLMYRADGATCVTSRHRSCGRVHRLETKLPPSTTTTLPVMY